MGNLCSDCSKPNPTIQQSFQHEGDSGDLKQKECGIIIYTRHVRFPDQPPAAVLEKARISQELTYTDLVCSDAQDQYAILDTQEESKPHLMDY